MFDIGFLELMVIGVLGLLVLGPERLPGAARSVGLMVGKVRRTLNGFQDELERQVRAEELQKKLKDPYATYLDDDSGNQPSIQPQQQISDQPYATEQQASTDQPTSSAPSDTASDTSRKPES